MTHSIKKWQLRIASVIMLIAFTLVNVESLQASYAKPGLITVKQSDGTFIKIRLYGDEHFNWRTTESGYTIVEKEDGLFYYADYSIMGQIIPTTKRVSINGKLQTPPSDLKPAAARMAQITEAVYTQKRNAAAANSDNYAASFPCTGTIRSAVILVEYADVSFSVDNPNQAFTNQLNEEGYSVAGATGSAKDYFNVNSRGQFDGQFDVYGPYKLTNVRSYYGGNDSFGNDLRPDSMIEEAVEMAHADGVDFSQYDFNEDGYIDNIFVYYAGHNEAEGASSDSVWPHKWVVSSKPKFNGKTLYVYACTSELRDNSGTTIAGIGTFCHEFGHVFGLADHYDTNGSTNGTSHGLGTYDIMTSGSYNNNGNTPPLHNGLELDMIGWNTPIVLDSAQDVTMKPIQEGEVYKLLTDVEGEYFLLENRDKDSSVWENYIDGEGLIITHVDRSSQYMYTWNQNGPNNNIAHECFRFIVAADTELNGYNWYKVPYPQEGNNQFTTTSSPAALSWSGNEIDINLVDIEILDNGYVRFSAIDNNSLNVIVKCDTEEFYVDVPFSLSATIYPEQEDDSVVWSSSNSAIATIDTEGVVTFLKAGTATFTATPNADSNASGSITITAVDLNGAKGYVRTNSGEVIPNATMTFYPATRIVDEYVTQKSPTYTRTEGASSYTTTTNELGVYVLELEEGYYEVEISATQYADLFEVIKLEGGSNYVDFNMSTYAESVDTIEVVVGQTDAVFTWNPQGHNSFLLTISNGSSSTKYTVTEESKYTVSSLNTNTAYSATVGYADGSNYVDLYSVEFSTLNKATTIPMINLSYKYSKGETLDLSVINITSSDEITWIFDGVQLPSSKVILDAGEHNIQAVIVRGSSTYRANKVIVVE